MKHIPKNSRTKIREEYTPDKSFEVIVQEVDGESKKIVLMLDLGDIEMDIPKQSKKREATSTSDKLEIPQDVIDSISDSVSKKDSEK